MPNYFPTSEANRREWLASFKQNLPTVAQDLGLDPREVQAMDDEITKAIGYIDAVSQKERELQQAQSARNDHRKILFAELDVFTRKLKLKPNYTPSVGQLLDISGNSTPKTTKSNSGSDSLNVNLDASIQLVSLSFKKPRYASVAIYCRRANEADFSLLRIVKGNSYKDTRSNLNNASSERREYYFTLVKDDEEGERSSTFTVAVPQ